MVDVLHKEGFAIWDRKVDPETKAQWIVELSMRDALKRLQKIQCRTKANVHPVSLRVIKFNSNEFHIRTEDHSFTFPTSPPANRRKKRQGRKKK